MGRHLERAVAILNGAVGDYLQASGNGLATEMCFARDGAKVPMVRASFKGAGARLAIFVHGLMNDESVWIPGAGEARSANFGARLKKELRFTPLYVRYNTGLSIAANGESLARLVEEAVSLCPRRVKEVLLIGYSMGGLVVRSACHFASVEKLSWLPLVRRAVYVGTPHLGAPMERIGKWVTSVLRAVDDPYTRLAAELGELRSAGIQNLGDPRHPVPLLESIRHCLVAGSLSSAPWLALWFGDALVPVSSATDGACFDRPSFEVPPAHVRIFPGIGHLSLPRNRHVYQAIRSFVSEEVSS